VAIKGSLKEASLPDVLQLLALGRKTGCLAVADKQNFGYIYFDEGRICYASIVNRRDRLGDILVKNSKITEAQLEQAIAMQEEFREQKLGEILVNIGAIKRPQLEEYMSVQIEEAVYFLFTWTSGTFNFEAGVKPERQDFLVRINPESLLLEGARRVDEWSLIEKKIPSFDLIFTVDQKHLAESGVQLSADQERIVPLLDGKRDIHQLVEDSGLVEFGPARVPPRGRPPPLRGERPLLHRAHLPQAGQVGGCGRVAQAGRRTGRPPTGGPRQPGVRDGADGAHRRRRGVLW